MTRNPTWDALPAKGGIGTVEVVHLILFGAQQYDSHVRRWRWWKFCGL